MKMYCLVIKNGKPFGRELNPYGGIEYKLIASGLGFMPNPKFKEWSEAESNLKEFEIDESQDFLWMVVMNEKSMKFGINPFKVGDVFKAELKGNKLFDISL